MSRRGRESDDQDQQQQIETKLNAALKRFGFPSFREGQKEVMTALMRGENALAVFPTGAGKSLCYQLPATLMPENGLTVVVSPLISLMRDQVTALRARGVIQVAATGSFESEQERRQTREKLANGTIKMIYLAPEQLQNEFTRAILKTRTVELFAIDEAHCVSSWGESFRPSFLRVANFALNEVKAKRILALTATATPFVAEDVCKAFHIPKENYISTAFYRKNLWMKFHVANTRAESRSELVHLLNTRPAGPTIIYATTQKETELLADFLRNNGFPQARCYHAGLTQEVKVEVQDKFMAADNNSGIIVGTIAFGMGIDKSNIRRVIHFNVAKSLEGYAQEIGRAGRDGQPSYCDTIANLDDVAILEAFACCDSNSAYNIHAFLKDFFDPNFARAGGLRTIATAGESKKYDMSVNSLEMLLTWLDIEHGLMETKTPIYDEHAMCFANAARSIQDIRGVIPQVVGNPVVRAAIMQHLSVKVKWAYVKVGEVANDLVRGGQLTPADFRNAGLQAPGGVPFQPRDLVLHYINQLEMYGLTVKGTGTQSRFLLKRMPSAAELVRIAHREYERGRERERKDLERIRQVLALVTKKDCQAKTLALYFGDRDVKKNEKKFECSNCTSCAVNQKKANPPTFVSSHHVLTQQAARNKATSALDVSNAKIFPQPPAAEISKIISVVNSYPELKIHPRTLARFGFEGRSPLLTKLKLTTHPAYGCLVGLCSWEGTLYYLENHVCIKKDNEI